MKIDRAIKVLSLMSNAPDWVFDEENRNSIKLGIEALKWRQEVVEAGWKLAEPLLPGETK